MKIALLEQRTHDAEMLTSWIRAANHEVVVHDSSEAFARAVARDPFDLLIISPRMSSADVLPQVSDHVVNLTPVLQLISRNSEKEMVAALNAGADDCIVTPPRRDEFFARIEALVRRVPRAARKRPQILTFGNITIDLKNRLFLNRGERIALTPKSYDLAVVMFTSLGQLLSRGFLMERIWGRGSSTSTRTLDTHVSRLRSDLGLNPENGWNLQSVYQHGYRLEQVDVAEDATQEQVSLQA
jgi:two-component system, OmpR family, response regulator RegX3